MNVFFGPRWDAPIVDDATEAATPVDTACLDCGETIVDGDQGFMRHYFTAPADPVDRAAVVRVLTFNKSAICYLTAIHRECHMLGVIGHMVGVCPCIPQQGSRRDQAREAMRRWTSRTSRP